MSKTTTLKTANIVGGLAVAAAFGTFAAAPGIVPPLLTHDKIEARIQVLGEKAAPFSKRITVLEEDLRMPFKTACRTRDELKRKQAEYDKIMADKKNELESLKKEAKEAVCDDVIISDNSRRGEYFFDKGIHPFPESLKAVCDKDSIDIQMPLMSSDGWRAFSGAFALLGLLNAAYYVLPGKKRKGREDEDRANKGENGKI